MTSSEPIQSRCPSLSSLRLSGTRKKSKNRTTIPNGTFMKKIQCQEAYSTSQPPRTGPIADVIEVKPDQVPIAEPRLSSLKEALIIARLPGTNNAPPIPWMQRAIIRSRIAGDRPHKIEASEKSITPIAKIRRRPKISPSEPPTRINEARKSEYASTTHCTSPEVALKARCRAGSATFTTEPSIKAMLDPRMVAARTHIPTSRTVVLGAGAVRITASSHGGL